MYMKNKILPFVVFFTILGSFFYFKEFYLKEKENENRIENNRFLTPAPSSEVESTSRCSQCGREFHGNGYEEQEDGSFKELEYPYSNLLCSPACARKAAQQLEDVANKYGIDLDESSSNRCQRCSGRYEDGFCNLCGGASPERVNQSNQNRANCEMCQGNKYVEGYDCVKVCPVCNGTGKVSY
jgi:hypothetical protein